ncbi:transposable element Tcb1 transposase [Trichonephila clavipes]|uniref:Transposable element Tcb1 transposase n=1 Tax=Trichonephila clavipes TaxID=2585209 RepID=A0A8X6UUF7_TRICX|nr:transposable element Tcb1 transposase [Trichonephila clavipes]
MTGHIYRDVILEQHVRLFRGAMGAEFLFVDDNDRPHNANIVDECLQSEGIIRMDWPAYSPDLNPIEHVSALSNGLECNGSNLDKEILKAVWRVVPEKATAALPFEIQVINA